MVAEKETLSLNKCPHKMPKRTKLLAQQSLPVHQPHSLLSEGFTVKAMMKNSVVSDLPELNALAPNQVTPGYRGWTALAWILSPCPGWALPKSAITWPVADSAQHFVEVQARLLERVRSK